MSVQDENKMLGDNYINHFPPVTKEEQIEENIGYNCSECSSLIEILSIDENNLDIKCTKNDNHNNKLMINNYLDKMKKYIDKKNLKDKCDMHNNKYTIYCINCKCHLCNECLKTRMHKNHNRIYLEEEQTNEEEINIIKNKIELYNNKIKKLKENKIK